MKFRIGNILIVIIFISASAASCGNLTNTSTTAANNSVSPAVNGLSLSLSLDAATYELGQDVSIAVDVKNTWPETNHVPVLNDWSYNQLTETVAMRPRCSLRNSYFPGKLYLFRLCRRDPTCSLELQLCSSLSHFNTGHFL